MMRRIFITILILSFGVSPAAATLGDPLSCDARQCCHPMPDHHLMTDMLEATCQCRHEPLAPCHLESDPSLPQQAAILLNDRSQAKNLPVLSVSVDNHQSPSLRALCPTAWQKSLPALHPPPLYLMACTFII